MNIMAINTTNNLAEITVKSDAVFSEQIKSSFSEHIMASIESVLEKSKISLSNLDAIGVVTGPGSFTGIRIGMAVAKGLACGTKIPLVSCNSFEQISYNINEQNFIVLLDSGNIEVYYAIFRSKKLEEMGHSTVEKISTFADEKKLKIFYSESEKNIFGMNKNLCPIIVKENTLANLVFEKASKKNFVSIKDICPSYIKLSQAEIGLEQNMKEHLSFRDATQIDSNALEIIDKQCFEGYEQYDEKSFLEEINEPSKFYYVAVYSGLVIGYIGVQTLGDELNLLKIAVLPQFRQLGVASKLLEHTFQYKKERNLKKYFLEVRESNEKAIKLYKKFGFKKENTREHYYKDGENAIVLSTL